MIFYRLACYTQQKNGFRVVNTALTMHSSEADGRKKLAAHKRHLKKVAKDGTGRLEKLTVDVEFLTKSDWMKLILADSPRGMGKEEDMTYLCDLISELEVVAEWEFTVPDAPKE